MAVQFDGYWIRITNDLLEEQGTEEGKWVVFLPKRLHTEEASEKRIRARQIQAFVDKHGLLGALVTQRHFDLAVFFTSADRSEIWKVRKMLEQELDLLDAEFLWKASFETENDWVKGSGDLWFLSELEDRFQRVQKYLLLNRREKARRVETNEVWPLLTDFRKHLLEANVMARKSMVVKPVFSPIQYDIDPSLVFVLMPFEEPWSDDFYYFVKRVGEALQLKVVRSDDMFSREIVINDIWEMINLAGMIVAEISVHNANVFYELGIAHTLGKKVVLLRQEAGEQAPFDIAFWRYFEYGLTGAQVDRFKGKLERLFLLHKSEFGLDDEPVGE